MESLKAARERVATEVAYEVIWLDAAESIARSLRELQLQAMKAAHETEEYHFDESGQWVPNYRLLLDGPEEGA